MPNRPNFLIIGAPKCGTTSLYHYLGQHPLIELSPIKEPKFFSYCNQSLNWEGDLKIIKRIKRSIINKESDYLNLFKDMNAPYRGEASPNYFHDPIAAKNIYEFDPNFKLIVILRNPVERCYSDWKHNVKMGLEPINNFKKALDLVEVRKKNLEIPYYDYLGKGNYATHLNNYYRFFKPNQLKIILYDTFKRDPQAVCEDILLFLGIRENFQFITDNIYLRNNNTPKYQIIHKLSKKVGWISPKIKNLIQYFNKISNSVPSRQRKRLGKYYLEEINRLEQITMWDLTKWKN